MELGISTPDYAWQEDRNFRQQSRNVADPPSSPLVVDKEGLQKEFSSRNANPTQKEVEAIASIASSAGVPMEKMSEVIRNAGGKSDPVMAATAYAVAYDAAYGGKMPPGKAEEFKETVLPALERGDIAVRRGDEKRAAAAEYNNKENTLSLYGTSAETDTPEKRGKWIHELAHASQDGRMEEGSRKAFEMDAYRTQAEYVMREKGMFAQGPSGETVFAKGLSEKDLDSPNSIDGVMQRSILYGKAIENIDRGFHALNTLETEVGPLKALDAKEARSFLSQSAETYGSMSETLWKTYTNTGTLIDGRMIDTEESYRKDGFGPGKGPLPEGPAKDESGRPAGQERKDSPAGVFPEPPPFDSRRDGIGGVSGKGEWTPKDYNDMFMALRDSGNGYTSKEVASALFEAASAGVPAQDARNLIGNLRHSLPRSTEMETLRDIAGLEKPAARDPLQTLRAYSTVYDAAENGKVNPETAATFRESVLPGLRDGRISVAQGDAERMAVSGRAAMYVPQENVYLSPRGFVTEGGSKEETDWRKLLDVHEMRHAAQDAAGFRGKITEAEIPAWVAMGEYRTASTGAMRWNKDGTASFDIPGAVDVRGGLSPDGKDTIGAIAILGAALRNAEMGRNDLNNIRVGNSVISDLPREEAIKVLSDGVRTKTDEFRSDMLTATGGLNPTQNVFDGLGVKTPAADETTTRNIQVLSEVFDRAKASYPKEQIGELAGFLSRNSIPVEGVGKAAASAAANGGSPLLAAQVYAVAYDASQNGKLDQRSAGEIRNGVLPALERGSISVSPVGVGQDSPRHTNYDHEKDAVSSYRVDLGKTGDAASVVKALRIAAMDAKGEPVRRLMSEMEAERAGADYSLRSSGLMRDVPPVAGQQGGTWISPSLDTSRIQATGVDIGQWRLAVLSAAMENVKAGRADLNQFTDMGTSLKDMPAAAQREYLRNQIPAAETQVRSAMPDIFKNTAERIRFDGIGGERPAPRPVDLGP